MPILFVDTATTAPWLWGVTPHDKRQPHLIRLSALLENDDGSVAERFSRIVRPLPSWPPIYEPEIARHGVTQGIAATEGCALGAVMAALDALLPYATLIVAHSAQFHRRVLTRTLGDLGLASPMPPLLRDLPWSCSMTGSANVVQVRLQKNGQWKWPSLGESYAHFARQPFAPPDEPIARGDAVVDAVRLIFSRIPALSRQERVA